MTSFQLFEALDPATEAALRASIERFGVLVPVARDQAGRIIDGHHRSRIADELGVRYRVDVIQVADEDEAREIARTLNTDRRHLTVEQRRPIVAALREQGHSLRAIAGAVGVSKSQVADDVRLLSTSGQLDSPDRTVGLDGKSRHAKRPAIVAAKNEREAERAQEALQVAQPSAGSVVDVKRAERIAREAVAEEARSTEVEPTISDDLKIFHGDFRVALRGHRMDGSIVISDPPYPREYLPLYRDLAVSALDGWNCEALVLMVGQTILPDVIEHVLDVVVPRGRWTYRWCGAYLTPGPATRVWNASVGSAWKPILVFDRDRDRGFVTTDVYRSSGDDKRHHHWGQDEFGFAQIIEAFTDPGDLVVDPFLGGGTTAVVCRDLGRRFVGCDVDAAAIHATNARLANG